RKLATAHQPPKECTMRTWLAAPILSCALLVTGAMSAGEKSDTPTVTDADDGKTIPLDKGGKVDLVLKANPTTGYRWQIVRNNPEQLKRLGKSTFDRPKGGAIGAGGTQTFRFQAEEPGASDLELVYRRPFEKEAKPAKTFKVTFTIK